jgi:hypothetical protein
MYIGQPGLPGEKGELLSSKLKWVYLLVLFDILGNSGFPGSPGMFKW